MRSILFSLTQRRKQFQFLGKPHSVTAMNAIKSFTSIKITTLWGYCLDFEPICEFVFQQVSLFSICCSRSTSYAVQYTLILYTSVDTQGDPKLQNILRTSPWLEHGSFQCFPICCKKDDYMYRQSIFARIQRGTNIVSITLECTWTCTCTI